MSKKQLIWYSGLWILPLSILLTVGLGVLARRYIPLLQLPWYIWTALPILPVLFVYLGNQHAYMYYYRDDFSPQATLAWRKKGMSTEKLNALYTPPRRKFLFNRPTGLVLAKTRSKYVCVPIEKKNIINMVLIGAPGAGKSAGTYISTLANNFAQQDPVPCFVIDIKGELHTASVHDDDANVRIIDPTDPDSWGWDPYYSITQASSDDEIKLVLEQLANTLIIESNEKNAFFSNSARAMFIGINLYFFRKKVWTNRTGEVRSGFSDALQELISRDPVELVKMVLADTQICDAHPQIVAEIGRFADAESEALNGIKLSLAENLGAFAMESVQRLFSIHHEKRTSPLDLNVGKSIFLAIPEHMLSTLATVFRMITYQTLAEMERRPPSAPAMLMLIDEFPRLGRLGKSQGTEVSGIFSALATLRSRGVSIAPISMQDLSQIRSIYTHEEASQIFALSEILCVLGCRDLDTAKMLSEQSGYYEQTKTSRQRNAFSGMQNAMETASTERRPVVDVADLMRLREEGGVAMWIEGRYCRARRIRWYEDPILAPIVNENKKHNEKLRKNRSEIKQDLTEEILFFDDSTITYDEVKDESWLSQYYEEIQIERRKTPVWKR